MSALLLVLLSAGPVDVVVIGGGESKVLAVLARLEPDVRRIDGAPVHRYLFDSRSVLGINDFESFTAAPIKAWPAALESEWVNGLKHCQTVAGPLPWRDTMPAVNACSKRLSQYLWQRYLLHVSARRVYEISAWTDQKKRKAGVDAQTYDVEGEKTWGASAEVTPAKLEAAIERVVTATVERKSPPKDRQVIRELVTAAGGKDLLAGQAVLADALALKKVCPALPVALVVSPDSVLAQTLAARWKASVPKGSSGAAATCSLALSQHEESGALMPLSVITATLQCGKHAVAAEAAAPPPWMKRRSPNDTLSERLIQGLSARHCP